ncbi:MAG: CoA transferase [Gammaproteobacteria bacterium]|nr:CoA transferase [Gammaproteobacteria bacterium]
MNDSRQKSSGSGGPFQGLRVVEIGSIGPGPFAAMVLSDMGAEVIKVDPAAMVNADIPDGPLNIPGRSMPLFRGRKAIGVDLKSEAGIATLLRMVGEADVLLEGFRPGVMERLGLGPDECLQRNPGLIYGRITGFGQEGPLAGNPGHDLNYIALAGVLDMIGQRGEPPTPPLSLVGDFGGGGMLLAFGVAAALFARVRTGRGQVIDAAMVDGASYLATLFHGLYDCGHMEPERGTNMVDSGAHFYNVYETSDGKWISIAGVMDKFYKKTLGALGINPDELPPQMDRQHWPELKLKLAEAIRQKTAAQWDEILDGQDYCYAPVLPLTEAWKHPHNRARESFVEVDGLIQPAPAPRFSDTPGQIQHGPVPAGQDTRAVLLDWGFSESEIGDLEAQGAVRQKT